VANVTTQKALNAHRIAFDLSMLYVAPYRLLRDDVSGLSVPRRQSQDRWAM
jgi:hypothetical protein